MLNFWLTNNYNLYFTAPHVGGGGIKLIKVNMARHKKSYMIIISINKNFILSVIKKNNIKPNSNF